VEGRRQCRTGVSASGSGPGHACCALIYSLDHHVQRRQRDGPQAAHDRVQAAYLAGCVSQAPTRLPAEVKRVLQARPTISSPPVRSSPPRTWRRV
jgi:hypothetical protein